MRVTFVAVFAFTAVLFVGAIARPGGFKEPKGRSRRGVQEWDASRRGWRSNPVPIPQSLYPYGYGDSKYMSAQRPVDDLLPQEGAYGDADRDEDFLQDTRRQGYAGLQKSDDVQDDVRFAGRDEVEKYEQKRKYPTKYDDYIDDEEYDYSDEEDDSDGDDADDDSDTEGFTKFHVGNSVRWDRSPADFPRFNPDGKFIFRNF
ncbi:SRP-independent targeting protein 1-like [Diprion similis]|uniref:SRP-independent targeting protein 1-like n=1 Tax=Diprion similis TaxID=362088 RepID=UPI001EF8B20B|nr:SRP-independent targeting protein 1-like [Diprion similis]